MKVGDLVIKTIGYGSEFNWIGLLIAFGQSKDQRYAKAIVLHDGEVDEWLMHTVKLMAQQ